MIPLARQVALELFLLDEPEVEVERQQVAVEHVPAGAVAVGL